MKKITAFGFLFIFLISLVYARECLDRITPSTNCQIYSPAGYDCTLTYDIVKDNGTIMVDNEALGNLSVGTGICNFTFNQPSGSYVIYLNEDNTSRILVVDSSTNEDFNSNLTSIRREVSTANSGIQSNKTYIEGNLSTIRNTLLDMDETILYTYTDVGDVLTNTNNILSGVQSNRTHIESQLTSNLSNLQTWMSSTFASLANSTTIVNLINTVDDYVDTEISSILSGISSNTSYLEGNISSVRSTQRAILNGIQSNQSLLAGNLSSIRTEGNAQKTILISGMSSNTSYIEGMLNTITTHITSLANSTLAGIWSYATRTLTDFSFNVGLNSSTLSDIDSKINTSHGIGLYNTSTVTLSSSNITSIANQTFRMTVQNKTEVYYNNSLGYPQYEIHAYPSGETINKSYNYYLDNTTIKNATYSRR